MITSQGTVLAGLLGICSRPLQWTDRGGRGGRRKRGTGVADPMTEPLPPPPPTPRSPSWGRTTRGRLETHYNTKSSNFI